MGSTYKSLHPKGPTTGKRPLGAGILPHAKPGHVAPKSAASPTQRTKKQMGNGQWVDQ